MKILLVEDEPKMADIVSRALIEDGNAVDVASDACSGQLMAEDPAYDLIILDIVLPDGNGLDICRALREKKVSTPVLMLTCKGEISDKILGLNSGADDYLPKPFDVGELIARVQALMRRNRGMLPERLVAGELVMDTLAGEVSYGGKRVRLTPKEYAILKYLLRYPNMVLSPAQLEQQVWNQEFDCSSNLVRVYIRNLREKLGDSGGTLIQTVYGLGYRLKV